jgi:micrococcal nuclease
VRKLRLPSLGSLSLLAILIAVLLGGETGGQEAGGATEGSRQNARAVRAVDGDTVEVRLGDRVETVRYIGVDTPESVKPGEPVECFGLEASHFNRRRVEGEAVRLRIGAEPRDAYGRLLAYVRLASTGELVNAELLRRGYATTLTIAPNDDLATRFARLERRAARREMGLWGAC